MPADALPVAHTAAASASGVPTTTVIFGPYAQFAGMTATITPSSKVVQVSTGAVVMLTPLTVTLDGTGAGSVALPNTDATGLVPSGFTYTLLWQVGRFDASPGNRTFSLPVAAGPTVNFDLIAPATVAPSNVAGLDGLLAVLLADKTSATYAAALQVPNYPNEV